MYISESGHLEFAFSANAGGALSMAFNAVPGEAFGFMAGRDTERKNTEKERMNAEKERRRADSEKMRADSEKLRADHAERELLLLKEKLALMENK